MTGVARTLQQLATAVSDEATPPSEHLDAFGVTAKVVVVVENQDPRVRVFFAIQVRSRESTQTSTDDNQVVDARVRFLNGSPVGLAFAPKLVRDLE